MNFSNYSISFFFVGQNVIKKIQLKTPQICFFKQLILEKNYPQICFQKQLILEKNYEQIVFCYKFVKGGFWPKQKHIFNNNS